MPRLIDRVVEPPSGSAPPPVDELLRVYLGQTASARVPVPDPARDARGADTDPQGLWDQLWDRLGDFA